MPHLNKGGKFIYGISTIQEDLSLQIPPQTMEEYQLAHDQRIILFTGSKVTGGFCVTNYSLLSTSKLSHILEDHPELHQASISAGTFRPYKGRSYTWLPIETTGKLTLPPSLLSYLNLRIGTELLSIRSSNIAFTMGAKGPLLDKAHNYTGEIIRY